MSAEARLRPGWRMYRFDEMAINVNERVDDPRESGVEYYVGLEHLDSDSLAIRRWGSPTEVQATKLRFWKGDIIFGRRRVYQRKLGVAAFDGICSAHAMVLRAKPQVVLPEFLPFFMQSDLFMERAKEISVGSLSPTINWPALAREEFPLPPVDEQRRLSGALRAMSRVADAHEEAASLAEAVAGSLLHRALTGSHCFGELDYDERIGNYSRSWPLTPIGELLTEVQYGISEPATTGGAYRMLRMMDLVDGAAVDSDACLVDLSQGDLERYRLNPGDVLFNRTNSYELVGRTGVYRLDGTHVFASYLIRLRTDGEKLLPDYLSAFLNAPIGRKQVMRFATRGVSQVNVNASNLKSAVIPLPSLAHQQTTVDRIAELKSVGKASLQRAAQARALLAEIANDAVG